MSRTLQRTLGLWDLVMIVVGAVIGSGIFIVPSAVLQQTGGYAGTAMAVWLLAGVLSLLGALTYGELGAMKPEAGGLYAYIRDAFGPLPAFLFGWTQFFVISSGSVATLAVAFTRYLDVLVPLSPAMQRVAAIGMIVAVAAINVRGTRGSAHVQNWTTGFKALAIVVISLALVAVGRSSGGGAVPVWPDSFELSMLSGVGMAMIGVLWAYEGWQYVTYSAGEAVDAQRVFPRALLVGTTSLIGIYLLANLGYLAALGPAAARSESVAADAVSALFGPTAGKVVAAVILVSMFSAANGFTLTAPRVYFAMARDGLFFQAAGRLSPKTHVPTFALVVQGVWTAFLTLTGTYGQLLDYVIFAALLFYVMTMLALFALRRKQPDLPRPYRAFGYPVVPVLYTLSAAAIALILLVAKPVYSFSGLFIVLLGIPVYFLWRRGRAAG
jgi:APA family basic amino acid/polyamine antiporter